MEKDYLLKFQTYNTELYEYKFLIFHILFRALTSKNRSFDRSFHSMMWYRFKNEPRTMFLEHSKKKEIINKCKEFVNMILELGKFSKDDFRLYNNTILEYNAFKYAISTKVCKRLIEDYPKVFLEKDTEKDAMTILKLTIFGRTKDGKDLY